MEKILDSQSLTVLIIDDSPDERDIYEQFLLRDTHQSYLTVGTDTGEDGLQLLDAHVCHLILLDFNLPDMNGLEFLEILQTSNTQIPVVMMTGQGNEAIAVQAIKQGAYDYLVKRQITPESLQSTVRNVLKQSNLQTRLHKSKQRQSLITSIALRIRQSLDLEQVLEQATVETRQLLECDRVLLYKCELDMSGVIVAESVNSQYQSTLGQKIVDTCFQNNGAQYYVQGKCTTINDIQRAGLTSCHIELLERFQVKANLVVPILLTTTSRNSSDQSQSTQLWGLLIAHQCDEPRCWTIEETELIKLLSLQLAIAIQQAELLSKTERSLQREQELNALKSQIIGTVSHEYRSPLASILASASTLRIHGASLPEAAQKKLLNMIENKVRHMNHLIEDMLFFNQIERGQIPIQSTPVNISDFLLEQIEEYKLKKPSYAINLEVKGTIEPFENDPKILGQIFNNLLSNAIKYSLDSRHIDIQLKGLASQVIVIIKDYGIGIDIDDQDSIFEPFHRGANVGTIPGTGLGLSIVQGCLDMCGGKISYTSEPNQGTKVTVGFPRKIDCRLSSARNCM
ncbi:multi-sensor signal transduction histidine kinase [[Leptolyngbya] sp. PCC 7376]|uniref:hybrid sensor histidine kinase/response regulator n=1 Tax=[Leptolyngbya] sp. PCC 7376 TaxID=111781 RepID=UPI00029F1C66|nr:ATP-binding protein [[Leptolyngbya] sp. PCC 7376]AFY36765.1 multi-sensor signal transduction histidine kinase [[Leptolyngbya] sp. PCC 7376]